MAKYVDGFVLVVPDDKVDEYKEIAEYGRDMWMKFGALEYFECRGDDLAPQVMGDLRSRTFPDMAGASSNETVWFSFIVFESKEHRDEVNAKFNEAMMEEVAGQEDMDPADMPFDMARMAYRGFKVEAEG